MTDRIATVCLLAFLGLAAVVGYRLLKTQLTADEFEQRLTELHQEHEQLTQRYNAAVTETAVTELLVEDQAVCVVIRTIDGELKRITTPYTTDHALYVDYIVLDGRLWIRRVFNDRTAPDDGVVIDPKLADIDWDAPSTGVGKAISRKLTDGRWVVTVTGDGSLGLVKSDQPTDLEAAPRLGTFDPEPEDDTGDPTRITPTDLLRQAVTPD